MTVKKYFADVAQELNRLSDKLKIGFSTHRPTIGENREELVADFLKNYLPRRFHVTTGLILASNNEFSNQADIIVVDAENNGPLYPGSSNQIWLVESVYSLIEVKTDFSPKDISDSIKKCRRFKTLPRHFHSEFGLAPKIDQSYFAIWTFNAPNPEVVKENYINEISSIPRREQPDFVICPGSFVISSGIHREIVKVGMPDSPHRNKLLKENKGDLEGILSKGMDIHVLGENSLLVWLIWYISFLQGSGTRAAPLLRYLPKTSVLDTQLIEPDNKAFQRKLKAGHGSCSRKPHARL